MHRTCIVIVNYNRWQDTVTCLQSVFQLSHDDYSVIVCDNGSSDGSVQRIAAWADGAREGLDLGSPVEIENPGDRIPWTSYTLEEVEAGGDPRLNVPLTLIDTGTNLGFAGACNVALRYTLAHRHCEYAWLLNNDTVVHRDALSRLVGRLQEEPAAMVCGSTLLHYNQPERAQLLGGLSHNMWTGISRRIGADRCVTDMPTTHDVERRLAYVNGASMLIDERLLRRVGLLAENEFHYGEELDLALRASPAASAWAPDSLVFHKGGATLGGDGDADSSWGVDMSQLVRSRLWIAQKHRPWTLPLVVGAQLIQAAYLALRGNARDARGMIVGLSAATGTATKVV